MVRFLKENKKGISLVEIIVAIAITGIIIVMLGSVISSGTVLFNRQNKIVDMTNESQLLSGQLEQSLMEATGITIYHDDANKCKYIYTGVINAAGDGWENPTGVERTLILKENNFYVSNNFVTDASVMNEGNMITSYIKTFDIKIAESSKETVTGEGGLEEINYINPIVVEVNYVLEKDDNKKSAALIIKMRNYIGQCFDGPKPVKE